MGIIYGECSIANRAMKVVSFPSIACRTAAIEPFIFSPMMIIHSPFKLFVTMILLITPAFRLADYIANDNHRLSAVSLRSILIGGCRVDDNPYEK
jgi:hypothetical protein